MGKHVKLKILHEYDKDGFKGI